MRVLTRKNSELVDKLVTIAYGDTDLVERAIRAVSSNGTAQLGEVVNYIKANRDPARQPRVARREQPRTGAIA